MTSTSAGAVANAAGIELVAQPIDRVVARSASLASTSSGTRQQRQVAGVVRTATGRPGRRPGRCASAATSWSMPASTARIVGGAVDDDLDRGERAGREVAAQDLVGRLRRRSSGSDSTPG